MNFNDAKSFEKSLDHLLTAQQDRLFIYVASHGYGKRLGNINFSRISDIIGNAVEQNKGRRVEGVIFGACEIGGTCNDRSLEMLHWRTNIVWVLAYRNIMDWMPSTLIDLNFMNSMMQLDVESLCKRDELIVCAASALTLFNPVNKIGSSRVAYGNNTSSDIDVKDAIRFLVKPHGRGQVFQDNSPKLISKAYLPIEFDE
ncbi:hypothetical protein METHB2_80096 [Candidatus Methylobacter favarea]|uniref:Uncharacterized protein n=2 Tax=Candidatus Methylobacter favarea TaxID=2707345 RepID=A0A8S0Y730_9GAMM|nr:hypothetical protein METHB2_80096 [Candidatus Methylobacter favarea]